MADTQQVETKPDRWAERRVARLAGRIDAFSKAHGGAEGQVAYLGERGARIVLVGADGAWGDLVARTYDGALKAVEKSGITVQRGLRRRVRRQGDDGPLRVVPHGRYPGRRPEQHLRPGSPVRTVGSRTAYSRAARSDRGESG